MYTNINILNIDDGIPIINSHNEKNIETIFGFYKTDEIIQGFTFLENIYIDKECLKNTIANSKKVNINDECILFYSFCYQISFAHYIIQTVPLLKIFLDNPITKLLVPRHSHSIIQQNIFDLLNITNNQIIFLEDKTVYNINKLHKNNYYDCPPKVWTENHTFIYKLLRNKLGIMPNITPKKRIYIQRDGVPNKIYGNSETGKTRKILNEEILLIMLHKYNFSIITLGNKTIEEKKELLDNSDVIITSIGANCLNLIFTNMVKNIILLSNDTPILYDTYMQIYSILNNLPVNYKLITYPTNHTLGDPTNQWNSPFIVDIDSLEQEVIKMIS